MTVVTVQRLVQTSWPENKWWCRCVDYEREF
jgi:hypothetical protein